MVRREFTVVHGHFHFSLHRLQMEQLVNQVFLVTFCHQIALNISFTLFLWIDKLKLEFFFYASSPQSTRSVFTLFSAFLMRILHWIAVPDGFFKNKEKSNRTHLHHLFRRIIMCLCAKTKFFYFRQQKWVSQFVTAQFYFVAAIRLFNGGRKHLLSCGRRAESLQQMNCWSFMEWNFLVKQNNDSNSYLHWSFVDQGEL